MGTVRAGNPPRNSPKKKDKTAMTNRVTPVDVPHRLASGRGEVSPTLQLSDDDLPSVGELAGRNSTWLAGVEGMQFQASERFPRDFARRIAFQLGTELSATDLDDFYETAQGFLGYVWNYRGTDAGGLWMVACGLPAGVRLAAKNVRTDVIARVRITREDLLVED